jgi:hypothetical protein
MRRAQVPLAVWIPNACKTDNETQKYVFNVHGSVHLGNICSIKGPTRCTYYVFFIRLCFLALHVSGAICTHPQELQL